MAKPHGRNRSQGLARMLAPEGAAENRDGYRDHRHGLSNREWSSHWLNYQRAEALPDGGFHPGCIGLNGRPLVRVAVELLN